MEADELTVTFTADEIAEFLGIGRGEAMEFITSRYGEQVCETLIERGWEALENAYDYARQDVREC